MKYLLVFCLTELKIVFELHSAECFSRTWGDCHKMHTYRALALWYMKLFYESEFRTQPWDWYQDTELVLVSALIADTGIVSSPSLVMTQQRHCEQVMWP